MLTDTHAHLASKHFKDDLPHIMARARDAGVGRIICVSTNLDDAPAVLKIAEAYEDVFATVGIHPCDADTVADKPFINVIRELAAHPKVVGIGEIGLDYFHQPPDGYTVETWKAQQASVLQAQLELAAELGLNVVLHNRESFADLSAQVKSFNGRLRAVFHCFTGTIVDAMPLIEQGHLVSFTGIVTFKNGQVIQECARAVPDGSFLLETDCPYLAPIPYRGQRNEPAYVAQTAEFVAGLRGVDAEHITQVTGATVESFFRKAGGS